MNWDKATEATFKQLIEKIPIFLRAMAEEKVSKKAESLAGKENHQEVTEKDMVDAFFAETPFGFQGPMKTDMQDAGIDYKKYGYGK